MELIKVGEKTYYIKNPTNIGIYQVDEENIYLIDSGNDKEAGKKILKIINEQGWKIKGIINTHSHADHIGGNQIIQSRTNCKIYAKGIEKSLIEYPILEPAFLYGAYPYQELKNKFLYAKPSKVELIEKEHIEGIKYYSLKGHSYDMIGIKTSDDVYFLGDSLLSEETIEKYHIFFLYDVKEYLDTLELIKKLKGKQFIPSHAKACSDLSRLISTHIKKIQEICNQICKICEKEKSFEEILKKLFETYNLSMNANQYVLIGSTLHAYLSYLHEQNRLNYEFRENQMFWKTKKDS